MLYSIQRKSIFNLCLNFGLGLILTGVAISVNAQDAVQPRNNSVNSTEQQNKPYLIVISGDGFRYDYATKYGADNLLALSEKGIRAEKMLPSYPSVTHPNHFTLLTGLYPGHTGIVGNNFYDPARKAFFKYGDGSWFGVEPVWATAEQQGMLTANFHWVDAEVTINGTRITYNFNNHDKGVSYEDQAADFLKQILSLPADKRPHLILMYFGDTDHAGHLHGPESEEVKNAVKNIDKAVGKINQVAQSSGLPVNFVFVSDHGMANIDRDHPVAIPAVVDTNHFVINNQNPLVNIYAKDSSYIKPVYEKLKALQSTDFDVCLNKDVPAEFHYGGKDDRFNRAGDIVLIARFPKTFNPKPGPGAHGYNPFTVDEMGASFFAWGPAFKSGMKISPFQNVEVYDLITSLLKIAGKPNDGKGSLALEILNK